jgi:hypothetical protein
MKKLALLTLVWVTFMQVTNGQEIPVDSLYLGQTPPGNTPTIFAPGIISVPARLDKVITFSPDGKCLFFSYGEWPNCKTMVMEYKNNKWSSPEIASFSVTRSVDEPIFSPDGTRIYYYAYDAPNSIGEADICYSIKVDSLWSEPINVGSTLNTAGDEFHPCVVNDSSIYFDNTSGVMYRSQYLNGTYQTRAMVPSPITPTSNWGDCYVSPDESYIIITSSSKGGYGGNDLFISYKNEDNSWTNPKNLGNTINTAADENCADVTPDGKYLTFWRNDDIFWVSASLIEILKLTNFNPYVKTRLKDQTDSIGHLFSYSIPDTTFIDDDGNNTLTYSAALSNNNPLPAWLLFNAGSGTFSGTLDSIGTFAIKVTATDTANAFVSTTFSLKVVGNPTNLIQQTFAETIQIYPNPTKGQITLSIGTLLNGEAKVEIYNLQGTRVFSETFYNTASAIIDLTGNATGFYIVKVITDGVIYEEKIIKE